jgi:alpha-N-acetylglucosamine transferase
MKTYYYTVALGKKFEKMAEILKKSAQIKGVDINIYSPEYNEKDKLKESRMAKINGFRNMPSGYDRAFFIDADCIVLDNLDSNISGAMIEDWGHRKRNYYPSNFDNEHKEIIWDRLNTVLTNLDLSNLRMDDFGKNFSKENNIDYFGDYEWNGGVICGSCKFMEELMNEWEKWHEIINTINEGFFIRDQISFKYSYYSIGVKKWGYRTIPRDYNWHTKRWGINENVKILHEAGFKKKGKHEWNLLLEKMKLL